MLSSVRDALSPSAPAASDPSPRPSIEDNNSSLEEEISEEEEVASEEEGTDETHTSRKTYINGEDDPDPIRLGEKLRITTKKRIFALTPGQYARDQFLDFGLRESILLYRSIVEPLQNKFDGDPSHILTFTEQLVCRLTVAGFQDILNIQDADGIKRHLLVEYGCLSKDDIECFVNSYANTETRQAQNDHMLCELLLNSVTKDFHVKIVGHTDKYTVLTHTLGLLLFKLMMSKAIVDTKATSTLYRERLMNLDGHMLKCESNITDFNNYVKQNIKGL